MANVERATAANLYRSAVRSKKSGKDELLRHLTDPVEPLTPEGKRKLHPLVVLGSLTVGVAALMAGYFFLRA